MSGWTDDQVSDLARRFAYVEMHKATWPAYVDDVRNAMIRSFVLVVVLGQDRSGQDDDVSIREVRSLPSRLARVLFERYRMVSPLAAQVHDGDDDDGDVDADDGDAGDADDGAHGESSSAVKVWPVQVRDAATAEGSRCSLCDAGARRDGGFHVGSQSFGMIPTTPCERVFAARMNADVGHLRGTIVPWMAYVDGAPLAGSSHSDAVRLYRSSAAAYAAAERAVRARHAAGFTP